MVVIIHGIPRTCDSVDAVYIVDITIAIVIDAGGAACFGWVGPHIRAQIFMGVPNAGINDRYHHFIGVEPLMPPLRSINISVRGAPVLARIVHSP